MNNFRTAACVALVLFVGMSLVENSAMRLRPAEPADRASAIFRLAGEFRVVFANLLWVKADSYHHEFIATNPHWCQNRELLGLMRVITALDPRFVEAYSTGAYVLMYGYRDIPRSLSYLHQGLKSNPKSRELNQLAAIIYAHKLEQPDRALPYARNAVKYSEDDWTRNQTRRLLRTIGRLAQEKREKQEHQPS